MATIKEKIMAEPQAWHLDKKVPLGLIFTVLLQFAGFIWFASQVTSQVETNKAAIEALVSEVKGVKSDAVTQAIQLGRIEAILENTNSSINRVERLLDGTKRNN